MTAFVESRLALLYEKHPWLRKDPEPGAGRIQNMDAFDALPITLKQCVHEYGFPIVAILFKFGIKNPAHVHAIVREIWDGPRGFNTGSSRNGQTGPSATVDFLLEKSGSDLHAATLARALWERGFAIVPRDPTIGMVEASKATVSNFDQVVTKSEKHKKRLRAAIEQYVSAYWPSLFRSTDKHPRPKA